MNTLTTDANIKAEESYIQGTPVDVTVEHSDTYYENYIEQFEQNTKSKLVYRFIKRSFDIVASLIMLILLCPLMLIIAISIKIDSKGPVIFSQDRMGKDGEVFTCYKFRSMTVDTPHDCPSSILENPHQYLTKVGRFIRKFSLDELPQLWCVLIGKMSLIGYRPLVLTEKNCNSMRERLGVFKMRPGISGYAQVRGRDAVYYKNKAILDAEYVRDASLWFDIKIFFRTISVVLSRNGNDA